MRFAAHDTLADGEIFDVPLTAAIDVPDGWAAARAWQSGVVRWSTIRNDSLLFDIVPDAGELVLVKTPGSAVVPGRPATSTCMPVAVLRHEYSIAGRRLKTRESAGGVIIRWLLGDGEMHVGGALSIEVHGHAGGSIMNLVGHNYEPPRLEIQEARRAPSAVRQRPIPAGRVYTLNGRKVSGIQVLRKPEVRGVLLIGSRLGPRRYLFCE